VIRLSDLSSDSHTGEFIADRIEEILNQVGSSRFSAIVSDNGSNVRKARDIIGKKYPTIENVRCISHCINLYSNDMVQHRFAERLLRRVNILASYFRNTAIAGKNTLFC
jgi:hypothetical protein